MFTPPNVSRITCQMSRFTCHVSYVTFFFFFFLEKVLKLIGEGLLSTGPTPSSFHILMFQSQRKRKQKFHIDPALGKQLQEHFNSPYIQLYLILIIFINFAVHFQIGQAMIFYCFFLPSPANQIKLVKIDTLNATVRYPLRR